MSGSAPSQPAPALKNILFATDFSPASEAALPFVRSIALHFGSTVHVVHAVAPEARLAVPLDKIPELDAEQSGAEAAMKALLAGEAFRGIETTRTLERGHVWEVLAETVDERRVELIVLGTHGRRGLKKLMRGSTAEEVFRKAACPVLTVGPHVDGRLAQAESAPVLFATDFSSGSEHALPYALSLARANRAPLVLLHAVTPMLESMPVGTDSVAMNVEVSAQIIEQALAAARGQMNTLVPYEALRDLKPEIVVESAPAAELILSIAELRHAGLIVMGAHRASAHSVAAHIPWATASAVVGRARCPVLTVRS
jgi:nucleotide-binding universal stress UspA family protein